MGGFAVQQGKFTNIVDVDRVGGLSGHLNTLKHNEGIPNALYPAGGGVSLGSESVEGTTMSINYKPNRAANARGLGL